MDTFTFLQLRTADGRDVCLRTEEIDFFGPDEAGAVVVHIRSGLTFAVAPDITPALVEWMKDNGWAVMRLGEGRD